MANKTTKNPLHKVSAEVIKKAAKKVGMKKISAPKAMSVEKFNSLSRAEQRVLIAKDVIAQVSALKYKASQNIYVDIVGKWDIKDPAREKLKEVKYCTVCALGACLVSTTRMKNNLTMGSLDERDKKATRLILKVFTPNQMALIETAFEKNYQSEGFWSTGYQYRIEEGTAMGGSLKAEEQTAAIKFGNRYPSDKGRILAIMQNIVTNKGTFKP